MLVRTRDGAVVHGVSYELPLRYKTARHASERHRIAKAVADLVAPGEVVGLTGGTTTTKVARALHRSGHRLSFRYQGRGERRSLLEHR